MVGECLPILMSEICKWDRFSLYISECIKSVCLDLACISVWFIIGLVGSSVHNLHRVIMHTRDNFMNGKAP